MLENLKPAALSDVKLKKYIEKGLITGITNCEQVQQAGVDLTTREIYEFLGSGFIGISEREFPEKRKIEPVEGEYNLRRGVFELVFNEGCALPKNITAQIATRSSGIRCGIEVARFVDKDDGFRATSGFYDAGFKTEYMAGMLIVHNEYGFKTERGAALAKMMFFESDEVKNIYAKKHNKSNHGGVRIEGWSIRSGKQYCISDFGNEF